MDFVDKIKQFSQRVVKIKDTVATEEATKMSLVVPLFQILGYDVFNPLEFCPEYTADVGIKKAKRLIMPFYKMVILQYLLNVKASPKH